MVHSLNSILRVVKHANMIHSTMSSKTPEDSGMQVSRPLSLRRPATASSLEWSHHPDNPFNWPVHKKWTTMSVCCWVTFIVGLNATSITTASDAISARFHLSNDPVEISFFPSMAWNLAAAVVPLVTLPLMDTFGVRNGYIVRFVRRAASSIADASSCRHILFSLSFSSSRKH